MGIALGVGLALGVAIGLLAPRPPVPAPPSPPDVARTFRDVRASVVDLRVEAAGERVGSGVVVGPLEILTARHLVLDAATPIEVFDTDGRALTATVRGTDARTDLALLDLSAPLQPTALGSATEASVGDTVLAVGNPFGLAQSLSVGVIGAKNRRLDREGGPRVGFLQLSIPLNPGNSGGPIFATDGRMIGLLTGTHTEGQAIGFAVPSDVIAATMPDLRAGRHISRAFLGLRADDTADGVRVASVIPTGPADAAGLRAGDLISSFDGVPIGRVGDLYDRLDRLPGGSLTSVRLFRDGELHIVEVELTDWAAQPVVVAGMTLRPAPGSGGRVVAIRPRSRAADAGVRVGDLVRTIDGLPVQAPADVRAALRSADTAAQLGIERSGQALRLQL